MDFRSEFAKKYGIEQESEASEGDKSDEELSSYGEEDEDENETNQRGMRNKESLGRRSHQAFLNGSIGYEMPHGSRTNYKGHWTKEEVSCSIKNI